MIDLIFIVGGTLLSTGPQRNFHRILTLRGSHDPMQLLQHDNCMGSCQPREVKILDMLISAGGGMDTQNSE